MVRLFDVESGVEIGAISDDQFQHLQKALVEESSADRDYYFDAATIEMLSSNGTEPDLVKLLRGALGDRDDMELRWERG